MIDNNTNKILWVSFVVGLVSILFLLISVLFPGLLSSEQSQMMSMINTYENISNNNNNNTSNNNNSTSNKNNNNTSNNPTDAGDDIDAGIFTYQFDSDGNASVTGFIDGKEKSDIVIPKAVKNDGKTYKVVNIASSAFINKDLDSVVFPSTLKTIEQTAFANNNLTSLILPDSLITIKTAAFTSNNIESIVMSKNIKSIQGEAFEYNKLTAVSLPKGVFLGNWVFDNNGANKDTTIIPTYF